jgi:hypothetical protein
LSQLQAQQHPSNVVQLQALPDVWINVTDEEIMSIDVGNEMEAI